MGVSPKTVNDWLSVLQASNQIVLLEPYHVNPGKRVVKSPKLYFADCGLVCFLLGLNAMTLAGSPLLGPIWETFVFGELRKELAWNRSEAALWFYRDQQLEIDFLISYGGRLHLADAKAKSLPTSRDFQSLEKVHSYFGNAHEHRSVIATADHGFPLGSGQQVVSGFEIRDFVGRL